MTLPSVDALASAEQGSVVAPATMLLAIHRIVTYEASYMFNVWHQ